MADFKLTHKAVQDLKQIWNYTFDIWSEKQADTYYKEIIRHCQEVADNPKIGKQYDRLLIGLRASKVNRHILFYRQIAENEIEVERILHERMDLNARLLEWWIPYLAGARHHWPVKTGTEYRRTELLKKKDALLQKLKNPYSLSVPTESYSAKAFSIISCCCWSCAALKPVAGEALALRDSPRIFSWCKRIKTNCQAPIFCGSSCTQ